MLRPQLAASTPVNGQILELELRTLLQASTLGGETTQAFCIDAMMIEVWCLC